ncbi:carbohydrate ABC transporter permease [uncultured Arthrobacter sp.]|uniref:carbohydrate ABC transporter permease n=1 Tax=uncultured Arthrobacter sp. TaxID=114050 RepID=UPI0025E5AEC8|nr:sugar ABC transporter permease [uncultured Arthrobacter sp.]
MDAALFLAPFLAVYAIFLLAPVGQALYMSGFNWDLLSPIRQFVGADNYLRMLWGTGIVWNISHAWLPRLLVLAVTALIIRSLLRQGPSKTAAVVTGAAGVIIAVLLGFHPGPGGAWNDSGFWNSLQNTLVFTLVSTPILIALGLAMALLLNNARRGRSAYRAVFFLPYVLPISAVTLIWSYLLNPDRGLIAGALGWFGVDGIAFLSEPALAMPAIIATSVWWSVGFNMVLFAAGLQDIEPAYYEAASLDGAGYWQRFRHITVPGLSHVTVLVTITQLIASFQIFGQVYIMTRGGPGTATEVLIQHVYEAGFKNYQLGYAAALSVFLFVVMAAVAAVQFRLISKDA